MRGRRLTQDGSGFRGTAESSASGKACSGRASPTCDGLAREAAPEGWRPPRAQRARGTRGSIGPRRARTKKLRQDGCGPQNGQGQGPDRCVSTRRVRHEHNLNPAGRGGGPHTASSARAPGGAGQDHLPRGPPADHSPPTRGTRLLEQQVCPKTRSGASLALEGSCRVTPPRHNLLRCAAVPHR